MTKTETNMPNSDTARFARVLSDDSFEAKALHA